MTTEISPNSRDGLSSSSSIMSIAGNGSSLQLSVEQWELLRRLRNSHLTKAQIIRAYDELDRLDRELGNLFNNIPSATSSTLANSNEPVSPHNNDSSPSNNNNNHQSNKRSHSHAINGRSTNGYHHVSLMPHSNPLSRHKHSLHENNSSQLTSLHESINQTDVEEETRELQELLAKGDAAVHNEISVFVYRYDLKQSQIARMAAVNQAYVSKFLRGDLFDLSENGRMAICRWYLRYKKIVQCMGGTHASAEFLANLASTCEPPTKLPRLIESQSNGNISVPGFDAPKRTRFTFRPEHLDILEKAFLDNPYPDPRRREEIARICNEARTRIDGNSEVLNERDRVTDAIVTHWFQNKRKMAKSQRVSLTEDSMSSNNGPSYSLSLAPNDYENIDHDDDSHSHPNLQIHQQQKGSMSVSDFDHFDPSKSSLDPQMAAYRAIMSRMVPFATHVNGENSPKRFIKKGPVLNPDQSSHGEDSDSPSPIDDRPSP